jgi:pimeloyl-ACP methyl ester carboxylesterase
MAVKPVVFIPGFPASELLLHATGEKLFPPSLADVLDPQLKQRVLSLLAGPDNPPGSIVAGEPIRATLNIAGIDIAKQAQTLYDILSKTYGYATTPGSANFAPVGWDWRKAVDTGQVVGDVAAAIDRLAAQNDGAKVVMMIHSTGGLVLRRCLELRPELANKIEQVIAFGIPWAGTLQSVIYLAVGQPIGFGPIGLNPAEVRSVMITSQAAYDLFPPDPDKTIMIDADNTPLDLFLVEGHSFQAGPLVKLDWTPPGAAGDAMRALAADADRRLGNRISTIAIAGASVPPITNVAGWGFSTLTQCTMAASGTAGVGGGRGLAFASTPEGDGTIPLVSSTWLRGPGVRTFVLPIGAYAEDQLPHVHSQIWDAPPVLQLLDQVLRDAPAAPFVWGAADHDEAVDPRSDVTVRLTAADANGLPLPNASFTTAGLPQPVTKKLPRDLVKFKLPVPRTNLRPNVGSSDLFRFELRVSWDGAPAPHSVPILFHL